MVYSRFFFILISLLSGSLHAADSNLRVVHVDSGKTLNVRSAPTLNSTVVGKLLSNDRRILWTGSRADASGNLITDEFKQVKGQELAKVAWLKIRKKDIEGWVYSKFLFPDIDLPIPTGHDKKTGLIYGVKYTFDKDEFANAYLEDTSWSINLNKNGTGEITSTEERFVIEWELRGSDISITKYVEKFGPDAFKFDGYPQKVKRDLTIIEKGMALKEMMNGHVREYWLEPHEYLQ